MTLFEKEETRLRGGAVTCPVNHAMSLEPKSMSLQNIDIITLNRSSTFLHIQVAN